MAMSYRFPGAPRLRPWLPYAFLAVVVLAIMTVFLSYN